MFARGSRYEKVSDLSHTGPDGRVIPYKAIRYIQDMTAIGSYTVAEGERLDHLSQRFLNDPEQFWRICDLNRAMLPGDLAAEPNRKLRIPPPQR